MLSYFCIPNNKQVTSSLITAPLGGGEAVVRQCREQGVVIIASGSSLGGFAGEEWLARSDPDAGNGEVDRTASLGFQQQRQVWSTVKEIRALGLPHSMSDKNKGKY